RIRELRGKLGRLQKEDLIQAALTELRDLIGKLEWPKKDSHRLTAALRAALGNGPFMVRSTTNAEDLPGYPGAGLYASFEQVPLSEVPAHTLKVYQSIYSEHAYRDRRNAGMEESAVYPAVLIQQMIPSTYAGVLHTQDPKGKKESMLIEAVVGLGEALVSGKKRFAGSAHQFLYDPHRKIFARKQYANKSIYLKVIPDGGKTENLVD